METPYSGSSTDEPQSQHARLAAAKAAREEAERKLREVLDSAVRRDQ